MKYAIVESGGKQYKAFEGETIEVDRLPLEVGTTVELDQVLLVTNDGSFRIGTPLVDGAKVKATVVNQIRGRKILVFKYKTRVRYRRTKGHRQHYTLLKIDEILASAN
ncbi:MAG: 50S ribosomal protein L21 [Anaerolineae bacterium]|nr:50S ribosomal protein L21 [Anaerolineae bacterium]